MQDVYKRFESSIRAGMLSVFIYIPKAIPNSSESPPRIFRKPVSHSPPKQSQTHPKTIPKSSQNHPKYRGERRERERERERERDREIERERERERERDRERERCGIYIYI